MEPFYYNGDSVACFPVFLCFFRYSYSSSPEKSEVIYRKRGACQLPIAENSLAVAIKTFVNLSNPYVTRILVCSISFRVQGHSIRYAETAHIQLWQAQ